MAVACPFCGGPMEFVTVAQAANMLGVERKTIRRRIKSGWYPGTEKVRGGGTSTQYRIPVSAILPTIEGMA